MPRWFDRAPFLPISGRRLALGLGLIGIGKPWGHVDDEVPEEAETRALLVSAVELGVRYFDTAPSYGVSEARFGAFLRELSPAIRDALTLATKFGEHWDPERREPFVDHRFEALARSLDRSLETLGRIDFLQLHKTTPEVLGSKDVERAFAYAASLGIRNIGASVSDPASASMALRTGAFSILQFPLNPASTQFRNVATEATQAGMLVATNRPFGMGRLLYGEGCMTQESAFRFLVRERFEGVVLSGTKSVKHLQENWAAFQAALFEEDLSSRQREER